MDDHQLITEFKDGSEHAFDELVRRHQRRAFRVARGVLRRQDLADEAVQDAFLKVHQALPAFKEEARFTTWLHRIVVNAALDLRSREETQSKAKDRAEQEVSFEATRPRGPRPLDELIREERLDALHAAMAKLPEKQRLTLELRVRQGLKHAEIAEILGCTVGTVKANVHHAVTKLHAELDTQVSAERALPGASEGA
ncbi:MAG: sigma-70 family RNA polymerase sigma factor [Acidobacteriota bacterium]